MSLYKHFTNGQERIEISIGELFPIEDKIIKGEYNEFKKQNKINKKSN